MDKDLDIITYAVTLIIMAAIMAAQFSARVRILSLSRIPSFGHVVPRRLFDRTDVSIQPQHVGPSAGSEWLMGSCVMSEDAAIVF